MCMVESVSAHLCVCVCVEEVSRAYSLVFPCLSFPQREQLAASGKVLTKVTLETFLEWKKAKVYLYHITVQGPCCVQGLCCIGPRWCLFYNKHTHSYLY